MALSKKCEIKNSNREGQVEKKIYNMNTLWII